MSNIYEKNGIQPAVREELEKAYMKLIADTGDITAGRLIELSSGKAGYADLGETSPVVGVSLNGAAAGANVDIQVFGKCDIQAGAPIAVGDVIVPTTAGRAAPLLATQTAIGTGSGGNFGNQPANDGVEVVSDSTYDTTQTVTIYGTTNGAETTVVSETVTLDGTDAVATTKVNWGTILAVVVSGAHAGTITVREASADQTITTLAAGTNSAGYVAGTTTNGYGVIPLAVAGGTSTKKIGVIGTAVDGTALTAVATLNGATPVSLTSAFATVDYVLFGDVASATTWTVNTAAATGSTVKRCGIALEAGDATDYIECFILPAYGNN